MTEALRFTPQQSDDVLQQAKGQAVLISDASTPAVNSKDFVFFAAFDGTDNGVDPKHDGSGNAQNTAIVQLATQIHQSENVKAEYYKGVGTPGAYAGSDALPDAVTAQTIKTAEDAYKDFTIEATKWHNAHPEGKITSMVTGFSRGAGSAAVFAQMVYDKGVVSTTDGSMLIPPAKSDAISAALIIDPVVTGDAGNMNFPANVKNLTVVRAENETRTLFEGQDYKNPVARVIPAPGNHCDTGDAYDKGLGAVYLQSYTDFFRKTGLPIADPDPARQFDDKSPVVVHSEVAHGLDVLTAPWNALSDDPAKGRVIVPHGDPVMVNGDATRFTDYAGEVVLGGKGAVENKGLSHYTVLPDSQAQLRGYGDSIRASEGADVTFRSTAAATDKDGRPIGIASGESLYQRGSENHIDVAGGGSVDIAGGNNAISVNGRANVHMEPGSSAAITESPTAAREGSSQVIIDGKSITLDGDMLASVRRTTGGSTDINLSSFTPSLTYCAPAAQNPNRCK